jgi:choline dehydrogenase-like flavoprotein
MKGNYDYVIAGNGSAGCVLTARLAEDQKVSIALSSRQVTHTAQLAQTETILKSLPATVTASGGTLSFVVNP